VGNAGPDPTITIASVLGFLGFVLSIVNWVRLRPVVFVTGPHQTYAVAGGALIPSKFTFELHNAGASGVTVSAVQMVTPGQQASRHNMRSFDPVGWLEDSARMPLEIPLRLEPYDTKVVVLDVARFIVANSSGGDLSWEFRVEWYGRSSWLRLLSFRDAGGGIRVRLRSESERRVRWVSAPVNVGPRDPQAAPGDTPPSAPAEDA
jgi:hypothetical protein